MSKFLIACGGTGGHLSPGIALAERLGASGHDCLLLVSNKEIDSRLCAKYTQLRFIRIPGVPFSLRPWAFVQFVISQMRAFGFSVRLLRKEAPDAIVAFGGFTSAAIGIVGRLFKVPLALHEANRRPGKAVRSLAPLASRIYLPSGIRLRGSHGGRIRYHGYPVRREIRRIPREQARAALGIDPHCKLLLVLGGSQGASALNEWVRHNLVELGADGVHVFCITGPGKGSSGVFCIDSPGGNRVRASFVPFCDRMAEVLSAADLAVTRAGAGTIAELVQCRLPSILIPFPYAADNHQLANARFLEKQGGGIVVEQSRMKELLAEVKDLIFNDWLLERFRANMRMQSIDAAASMVKDLENLLREHEINSSKPNRNDARAA